MSAHGSVRLRWMTQRDVPLLHAWRNTAEYRNYCTRRRTLVTEEEFRQELARDFAHDRHVQVMIEAAHGEVVGTAYAYGLNYADGHVFVTIYVHEPQKHFGVGATAFALFCRDLLERMPLYKIYVDVLAYNRQVVRALRRAGAHEEGCFKEHRRVGEERFDMFRFALYRETMTASFLCR